MARRDIKPRRPELEDDFSVTGDENDDRPVSTEKKSAKKSEDDDYFGIDSTPTTKKKPVPALADDGDDDDDTDEDDEDSDDVVTDEEEEDDVDHEEPVKPPRRQGKTAAEKPGKKGQANGSRRKVVSLDSRKLTKKDQVKLALWKGASRAKALDTFFRGRAESAKKKFGHNSVFVGSEADALIIGIPMYGGNDEDAAKYPGCLPMEFVIAQDVFPLGLVLQLVAKTGVGKSAMLAEFGRWFNLAGGGLSLKENETKFNPKWYRSIMGKESFDNRTPLYRCKSVEDWQKKLTFAMQDMQRYMDGSKEEPGPGRTFPVLFGVDSIMGKMSEDTQDKILGKKTTKGGRGTTGAGAADRGFPIEALKITRYMRTIPQEMDNWPFSLVLVNHLRIAKNEDGIEERRKAGGEQVNFQESFELELSKVGGHKKKIECTEWEGYPIRVSCEKNSFGPTHRSIVTRLIWWEEENEDGDWEQKTVWDWDWSTVHLLNNILRGEKASPRLRAALKEIDFHLDCPSVSDVENRAWSRNLGMKAKDAAPWSEVGAMIRQDGDLMDQLRKALRINRRPLLEGNYLEQLDALAEDMP